MELTDTETAVLDFERDWWLHPAAKETAILERFGWSAARHYQVVAALLERPEALAYDAMTVKRLARLRDRRRARRVG